MVRRETKGSSGVLSQGETLDELEANIRDAYNVMVEMK